MSNTLKGESPLFLIAEVAVDKVLFHFDKPYDYSVPENLKEKVTPGCRVLVPFGDSKTKRIGMVVNVYMSESIDKKTKEVHGIIDSEPMLNEELIKLVFFIKQRYFCTLFDAVKLLLPAGSGLQLKTKYTVNTENMVIDITQTEALILDFVRKSKSSPTPEKILLWTKKHGTGEKECKKSIENLVSLGLLSEQTDAYGKIKDAMATFVSLRTDAYNNNIRLTEKQKILCEFLIGKEPVPLKEAMYFTGVSNSTVNTLQKRGIIECIKKIAVKPPCSDNIIASPKKIILTDEQTKAFDYLYQKYKSKTPSVCLLFGITGSGKTSVFMSLADRAIQDGKGVIIMVPEISLTPQLTGLFKKRFGENIAVFHSGLSARERMDEWKRVKRGDAKIAIGTRSAVFAPLENIGLIIMDEEQEYTYKSDANPRFHAREIAKFRCKEHACLLVLSSATPSIETYYFANTGRYGMAKLKKRYGNANLPEVSVVDMNKELIHGNAGIFSSELLDLLHKNIKSKKQSILLLNRRGHSTFACCSLCGTTVTCPNCSISLIYHSSNKRFMCHYCGYSTDSLNVCPSCGNKSIKLRGYGTQKIEEELNKAVPDARILRMDTDSTYSKFSYEENLRGFAEGKYDIIIGTQMVAKGLDFPNVTLACVLSADQSLYNEDFRSYERTFSLITQVVGRSGRGDCKGKAIIQTYTPENPIVTLASSQNYENFYDAEIKMRKAMIYPPFSDIALVSFSGENEAKTIEASNLFLKMLKYMVDDEFKDLPIILLGPSAAAVTKVDNKYRYKIIIKCRNNKRFREMLAHVYNDFLKTFHNKNIKLCIDINPDIII